MAAPSNIVVSSFDGAPDDHKLDQDFHRDMNKKHKWALGGRVGNGYPQMRPDKALSQARRKIHRHETEHTGILRNSKLARKQPRIDSADATSDSSAEEEVRDASAAPEPDADIAYSYDAKRGPGQGSEILSLAINKAVERFENKATEKLVKDEYEVVAKEPGDTEHGGYTADEDDYELV